MVGLIRIQPCVVTPTVYLQERVHVDQTFQASIARVHHHLGADADRLLKSRFRLINVWRPIGNPVADKPLAVSDWRTLDTEHDLVTVRYIYPDREGGTSLMCAFI